MIVPFPSARWDCQVGCSSFFETGAGATAPAAELPRVVNTAGVLYFIYATPSEWYQDGGGFVANAINIHKPATSSNHLLYLGSHSN